MPSKSFAELTGAEAPAEKMIRGYLENFLAQNKAARVAAAGLRVLGIGIRPLLDHAAFRSLNASQRAEEFLASGFRALKKTSIFEDDSRRVFAFQKKGCPVLLIEEPRKLVKGNSIFDWVKAFGEKEIYRVGVSVEDAEQAAFFVEKQSIPMAGNIQGDRGDDLRWVQTEPEVKNRLPFSCVVFVERHRGVGSYPF